MRPLDLQLNSGSSGLRVGEKEQVRQDWRLHDAMCSTGGTGDSSGVNSGPQFAGITELDEGPLAIHDMSTCQHTYYSMNICKQMGLYFKSSLGQDLLYSAICESLSAFSSACLQGSRFPAAFLLVAVVGAAMAGAALASLFHR